MSTHSLRRNLSRHRPQATGRQKAMHSVRKYAPWVAAVCIGSYLPPKVMSATYNWLFDKDDIWNKAANWVNPANGANGVPGASSADDAVFQINFGLNRTISLAPQVSPVVAGINPILSSLKFDDTVPTSTLTIAAGAQQIKLSGNTTTIDVSKGNTLTFSTTAPTLPTLVDATNGNGITKTNLGVLNIPVQASYTGATVINQGVLAAAMLANGGANSSIGASSSAPANLVINGGTLRYTAGTTVAGQAGTLTAIDRGFTVGTSGATLDSTNVVATTTQSGLKLTGAIAFAGTSPNGSRTLTLRGTSTAINEIASVIGNASSSDLTSLVKLDTGLWALNRTDPTPGVLWNTYTGDTDVERGTLRIVFPDKPAALTVYPSDVPVINPLSKLKLGSTPGSGNPGGGILDIAGNGTITAQARQGTTAPNIIQDYHGAIQAFSKLEVNAGINQIIRTAATAPAVNAGVIALNTTDDIIHHEGGDLRIGSDNIIRLNVAAGIGFAPTGYSGILNGWTYRDDSWASTTLVDTSTNDTLTTVRQVAALPTAGYKSINLPSDAFPEFWNKDDNISVNSRFTDVVVATLSGQPNNEFFINSLRFTTAPAAPSPNKQFSISNGDDPVGAQVGRGKPTTLTLRTGGLMQASTSGVTEIDGGAITSGSGDFDSTAFDYSDAKTKNGGTLGRSEIFAIIRNASATNTTSLANALFVSSMITDYISLADTSIQLSTGITKSGTGNLVLTDGQLGQTYGAYKSDFTGDVYINEGGIIVRVDHALGATHDSIFNLTLPGDTNNTRGKTYLLGTNAFLDFQGVNYTTAEPIKINQGELRGSSGRSTFAGSVENLNEDAKAIINVGTNTVVVGSTTLTIPAVLELNGDLSGDAGFSKGGYSKQGAGLLVVNGNVSTKNASEFVGAGDLELLLGSSAWNGSIHVVNGNLSVVAGTHTVNGGLSFLDSSNAITGHVLNAGVLALTNASGVYKTDLQQTGTATAGTIFGNINQGSGNKQVFTGDLDIQAGTVGINGSIDFGAVGAPSTANFAGGSLNQLANIDRLNLPTTTFFGPVNLVANASTSTLNHNTDFKGAVSLSDPAFVSAVISGANTITTTGTASNLVLNGIGTTTFENGLSLGTSTVVTTVTIGGAPVGTPVITNSSLTATKALFTTPFNLSVGTVTLNGQNVFTGAGATPAFLLNGGAFAQTGIRRSPGLFAVADTFNGDLSIGNASATVVFAPVFNGSNVLGSNNIVVTGYAPLLGTTAGSTTVTLANADIMSSTGYTGTVPNNVSVNGIHKPTGGLVTINGGELIVASSNALGQGVQGTGASDTFNITLQGEKPALFLQRGVETAANSNIIIGYSSSAYVSGIAITNYGSGYTSAPMVSIGSLSATGTPTVSGGFVNGVTMTSVGTNYTAAPPVTFTASAGSGAAGTAVLGGAIIRGVDQHNVIDGSIVLDNVNPNTGKLALGIPLLSVGQDDTLQIKGNIYGNSANAPTDFARRLTTALIGSGSTNNSSSGIIILSGQVSDVANGASTTALSQLKTEWAGNNDLNIQVEKQWNANGTLSLVQGVMRYTNPTATTFYTTGGTAATAATFELSTNDPTSIGYNAINTTASFFLTKAGQSFNPATFNVQYGNTDRINNAGANSGYVSIGGENTSGTVTYSSPLITLFTAGTSASIRDLRLSANSGGTVDIASAIVGSASNGGLVSIDKIGDGTVRLLSNSVASTLNRAYILGGTLELAGFATAPGVQRLGGSTSLILGGGTVRLDATGASAGVAQNINGATLTLRNGASSIQVVNPTTQTVSLTVGSGTSAVSRPIGSAVRFVVSGDTAKTSIILSSNLAVNTPVGYMTYGTSTDPTSSNAAVSFAMHTAATATGTIAPFVATGVGVSNTPSSYNASGLNVSEVTGATSTGFLGTSLLNPLATTLNSVRFTGVSVPGANNGTLNLNGLNVTVTQGILVASDVAQAAGSQNDRVITNGNLMGLTTANFTDLIIQNWGGGGIGNAVNNAPKLTIAANIINNATTDNALTLVGDGTTVLTGANTFGGNIYLSSTLEVGAVGALGNNPATGTKTILLEGGTLHLTNDITWDNRNITLYGDRSTIQVDAGKTFTINSTASATGIIQAEGNEVTGYASTNIYNGDLVIAGGGTVRQIRDITNANTMTGQVLVQGNSRLIFEGNTTGFLGSNLSWMDGTTIAAGSTLELRPTNTTGTLAIPEWIHLAGSGQLVGGQATGGAIEIRRPLVGTTTTSDHDLHWTGPVQMDAATAIFVDDSAEGTFTGVLGNIAGVVGMLTFDDNIFDGGGTALTKRGAGTVRFLNNRIQNLSSIAVSAGEVRFDGGTAGAGGLLGTIGSATNAARAMTSLDASAVSAIALGSNNYFTGTSSITVGNPTAATATKFNLNPRLDFSEARGTHNVDIALNGGYLGVQSADAPLQATNFSGILSVTGASNTNALEASYTTRINPVVMFGPVVDGTLTLAGVTTVTSGGFTKFGNNEVDFVNGANTFTGELVVARGGGGVAGPGVGLYDKGAFTGVSSVRLTNDGTLFLDSAVGLDASATNNNVTETSLTGGVTAGGRIKDTAAIHLGGSARLRLTGSATDSTVETVGALNLHRGSSAVELVPTATAAVNGTFPTVGLNLATYSRDAGSVVNFRDVKADSDFGSSNASTLQPTANVTVATIPTGSLIGGSTDVPGNELYSGPILVGAFGGVVAKNIVSLAPNSTLATALVNNDLFNAGRGLMTIETTGGKNYIRPLQSGEYFNATVLDDPLVHDHNKVTDTYDFLPTLDDGSGGTIPGFNDTYGRKVNLRLTGGFGAFTSYADEALFATELLYVGNQNDNSRKQDSLYRVLTDIKVNSLTFAAQTNEMVDLAGNRMIVEIEPNKKLTISSGMILNGGFGIINSQDAAATHSATSSALIRGGTLDGGTSELIIQNVAASLNETTGVITNNRLAANANNATVAGLNYTATDLTISSSISGTGGLTKSGGATVNLSGVNTYSGDTNITEGILRAENDKAFGSSNLIVVSGNGEPRISRSITIGDAATPHALTMRFTNLSQVAQFRSEVGNNTFNGDIQVDSTNSAGERYAVGTAADVSIINGGGSAFRIGGDIYGLNSTTSTVGTDPLNDLQRGRQSRVVGFQNAVAGGVMQLRGNFKDLQSGAIGSPVTTANDGQVLRSLFTGVNNGTFQVYGQWDAAGSMLLRQGQIRFMPGQTNFFTTAAVNAINPNNVQGHPTIGDASGGDTLISLTTAGQDFNAPTLNVLNGSTTSSVTLAGENTSGLVQFFQPAQSSDANSAIQRTSVWDRNVRLFASPGGTVEVDGRITDSVASGGNGSISKIGSGTVIFRGMDGSTNGYTSGTTALVSSNYNDFDKVIAVGAGRLVFDFDVPNSTATNIWGISTGVPLLAAGGKLEFRGDPNTVVTQAYGALTIRPGASEIAAVPSATVVSSGINLNITGAVTQTSSANGTGLTLQNKNGGTVNFVGSTGYAIKLSGTGTAVVGAAGGFVGPWATFGSTVGTAKNFAVTDATGIVGPLNDGTASNNPSSYTAGQHVAELDGGNSFTAALLTPNVSTVRFGATVDATPQHLPAPTTLNLPNGFILGNSTTEAGAFLVPTGVSALKTITGGTLTGNGSANGVTNFDIIFHNYGTGGLNVMTPIIGLTQNVVLSGPGRTRLLAANQYTGATYLNDSVVTTNTLNDTISPLFTGVTTTATTTFALPVGSSLADVRVGSTVTFTNGAVTGTAVVGSLDTVNRSVTLTAALPATLAGSNVTVQFGTLGVVTSTPTLTTVLNSNSVTASSAANLAVGQTVVSANLPLGTTITAISGTTLTLSQIANASTVVGTPVASNIGLANSLGLSSNAAANLVFNGGTLRYTGPTVVIDRQSTLGEAGAIVDVSTAGTTLSMGAFTLASNLTGLTTNPYSGGLTKIGPGTMVMTGTNTYSGLTDVKEGTLAFTGATSFGSSNGVLDSTIVRSGATLRAGVNLTTGEWMNFENNATLELTNPAATGTVALNLDGVTTLQGRTLINYNGAAGGNNVLAFNPNAGYITGAGTLVKGTVNNGLGGSIVLNENSPEWTGSLEVLGGRVVVRSLGSPVGSGTTATTGSTIKLGTSGVNDLRTPTSPGFAEANLFFANKNVVSANGGATLTGSFDTLQSTQTIAQDIIVNKADTTDPNSSPQLKQIGVIPSVTGGGSLGLSLDQYNLNGDITLNDNLTFYVENNFLNVNAGQEYVNFNVNGHLTGTGGGLSTKINVTGRPSGALLGAYNNLFVVVNLNNANPNFAGNVTIGNVTTIDIDGNTTSNADAGHVLRINNDLALNAQNSITLLNDSTVQLNGHSLTIGNIIDGLAADGDQNTGPTVFDPAHPDGTTAYIISGARSIVENVSLTPATLTINQATNTTWKFLLRDGTTAAGEQAGAIKLVKNGPGTIAILNPNTYSGGTIVNNGVLALDNTADGSAVGTGNITVHGGTLAGITGFLIGGDTNITNGQGRPGALSPGEIDSNGLNTANTLNFENLTFGAGGYDLVSFDLLSAQSDGFTDLVVSDTLAINTQLELQIRLGAKKFAINDPTTLLGGEHVQLFASNLISFGMGGFFSYQGRPLTNGSDIQAVYPKELPTDPDVIGTFRLVINPTEIDLYAVPEPSVALTLASGIGMLLGLQRFRRRSVRA